MSSVRNRQPCADCEIVLLISRFDSRSDAAGDDESSGYESLSPHTVCGTLYFCGLCGRSLHTIFAYLTTVFVGTSCLEMNSKASLPVVESIPWAKAPSSVDSASAQIVEEGLFRRASMVIGFPESL